MNLLYLWAKLCKKIRGSAIIDSKIDKTSKIEAGSEIVNSTFARHSFCGYNCEIINCNVGSFCSIANNVVIGGGMHPMNWIAMSPVFYEGRDSVTAKFSKHKRDPVKITVIGHDVWIGQNVLIKQGIHIGTGAVIGMGSIVTKDVEPYSIVVGNPARFIRKRFSDKIIQELLDTQWWELSENEIFQLSVYIKDPIDFLRQIKSRIN